MVIFSYPATTLGVNDLSCVWEELLDVSHKSFNIGLKLQLKVGTLERLRHQYPDTSTCLREMLLEWLKKVDPPPTWEGLACALESRIVGEAQLAEQLRTKYSKTKEAGQLIMCISVRPREHVVWLWELQFLSHNISLLTFSGYWYTIINHKSCGALSCHTFVAMCIKMRPEGIQSFVIPTRLQPCIK